MPTGLHAMGVQSGWFEIQENERTCALLATSLLTDDDVAFFETFENFDPFATHNTNADILAALAGAVFDNDEAASFKCPDGLWWQPQGINLAFEGDDH
jgi:hypothetical protein